MKSAMNLDIVSLNRSQIDQASKILASAFDDDPMFHYITPKDERSRVNAIQWVCKTALNYSQPYSHIYTTTDEMKGIAAWIPPGHFPLSMLKLLQAGLYALPFKMGWGKIGQSMSLLNQMDELHERDIPQPHWYLFMLGVAPAYQGQGIGRTLLQPILNQADREGLPCYLETSTEGAICFYKKNGFDVLRSYKLAQDSPSLWTMKREPQQ